MSLDGALGPHRPGYPVLRCSEWTSSLLDSMYNMFKEEEHCDVELTFRNEDGRLDDRTLRAHSVVLNASSAYFENADKVRRDVDNVDLIELPSALNHDLVEPLVHFFYSGSLVLPGRVGEGERHELLRTVELLELKSDKLRVFLSDSDADQIMVVAGLIANGILGGVEENMDTLPDDEANVTEQADEIPQEIVIKQEPLERHDRVQTYGKGKTKPGSAPSLANPQKPELSEFQGKSKLQPRPKSLLKPVLRRQIIADNLYENGKKGLSTAKPKRKHKGMKEGSFTHKLFLLKQKEAIEQQEADPEAVLRVEREAKEHFKQQKILRQRLEEEQLDEEYPADQAPKAVRALVADEPGPLTLLPGVFKNGSVPFVLRKDPTQCQPSRDEDVEESTMPSVFDQDREKESMDAKRRRLEKKVADELSALPAGEITSELVCSKLGSFVPLKRDDARTLGGQLLWEREREAELRLIREEHERQDRLESQWQLENFLRRIEPRFKIRFSERCAPFATNHERVVARILRDNEHLLKPNQEVKLKVKVERRDGAGERMQEIKLRMRRSPYDEYMTFVQVNIPIPLKKATGTNANRCPARPETDSEQDKTGASEDQDKSAAQAEQPRDNRENVSKKTEEESKSGGQKPDDDREKSSGTSVGERKRNSEADEPDEETMDENGSKSGGKTSEMSEEAKKTSRAKRQRQI